MRYTMELDNEIRREGEMRRLLIGTLLLMGIFSIVGTGVFGVWIYKEYRPDNSFITPVTTTLLPKDLFVKNVEPKSMPDDYVIYNITSNNEMIYLNISYVMPTPPTITLPPYLNNAHYYDNIPSINMPGVYGYPTTTTIPTTTTLIHKNPAPMFGLFDRGQMETQDYRCYVNYTVTNSRKSNSGEIKRVVEAPDCDDLIGFYAEIESGSGYGIDKKVTSIWLKYNNGTIFNVWN